MCWFIRVGKKQMGARFKQLYFRFEFFSSLVFQTERATKIGEHFFLDRRIIASEFPVEWPTTLSAIYQMAVDWLDADLDGVFLFTSVAFRPLRVLHVNLVQFRKFDL